MDGLTIIIILTLLYLFDQPYQLIKLYLLMLVVVLQKILISCFYILDNNPRTNTASDNRKRIITRPRPLARLLPSSLSSPRRSPRRARQAALLLLPTGPQCAPRMRTGPPSDWGDARGPSREQSFASHCEHAKSGCTLSSRGRTSCCCNASLSGRRMRRRPFDSSVRVTVVLL